MLSKTIFSTLFLPIFSIFLLFSSVSLYASDHSSASEYSCHAPYENQKIDQKEMENIVPDDTKIEIQQNEFQNEKEERSYNQTLSNNSSYKEDQGIRQEEFWNEKEDYYHNQTLSNDSSGKENSEIRQEEFRNEKEEENGRNGNETETEYFPETIELGNKIRIDIPEGFQENKDNHVFNSCRLDSDLCSVDIIIVPNSTISHEAEKEIKSRKRRVKRIITDKEIKIDRHTARYIETHVVKNDYELCFYIGLIELHENLIKFEVIKDYYDGNIGEEMKKIMRNTYYAYWD